MNLIERLFDDTLWIYTAILGSLVGAAFLAYFKDTNAGIWLYNKFDGLLDYLINRWGFTWLEQSEDAWAKKYPDLARRIKEIEERYKNELD
jgi:hypothetical protein